MPSNKNAAAASEIAGANKNLMAMIWRERARNLNQGFWLIIKGFSRGSLFSLKYYVCPTFKEKRKKKKKMVGHQLQELLTWRCMTINISSIDTPTYILMSMMDWVLFKHILQISVGKLLSNWVHNSPRLVTNLLPIIWYYYIRLNYFGILLSNCASTHPPPLSHIKYYWI